MDRSQATFSSIDVDAVDYVKYPSMADVGMNFWRECIIDVSYGVDGVGGGMAEGTPWPPQLQNTTQI